MVAIVEEATRKTYFEVVPKRDKKTLVPIVKRRVASDSVIWTDEWKSYACLDSEGYIHGTVNHTKEFKSDIGVCTNYIEGVLNNLTEWNSFKHKLYAHIKSP